MDALKDRPGTFHAFKGGRAGPRLDIIGVRGGRVLQANVNTTSERVGTTWLYPSDHYLVEATIVPDAGSTPQTPKR